MRYEDLSLNTKDIIGALLEFLDIKPGNVFHHFLKDSTKESGGDIKDQDP